MEDVALWARHQPLAFTSGRVTLRGMCARKMVNYKSHFLCLPCRHVAKYPKGTQPRCPSCREPMVDVGWDFKAPRRDADNQWRKLEVIATKRSLESLFESRCPDGWCGPGLMPRTLADAKRMAKKPH